MNFGVSPGDDLRPEPYAYVGPWVPRHGEFWNESFGAARSLSEVEDLVAFFVEGAQRATSDPTDGGRS